MFLLIFLKWMMLKTVSKTVETFGQLDILINNAGVLDKGLNAIDQIDYDDLNRVIDINQKEQCIVCQKL